jgi:hypothetical protein
VGGDIKNTTSESLAVRSRCAGATPVTPNKMDNAMQCNAMQRCAALLFFVCLGEGKPPTLYRMTRRDREGPDRELVVVRDQ